MTDMIRQWFQIVKREDGCGYDVICEYCNKVSSAWDYKRNAVAVGYTHVATTHMAPLYKNAGFRTLEAYRDRD